ncbi:PaaI family thioesterase [Caldimonas tepidiphila]|uniref:PaaI family thioesterase n=1 Tax=Caldimonas tepidiphila TaxID=2315841 RepID=UPI001F0C6B02|nr:PaaI family thioesterase [Caldimonas tepidiphila]
MKPHALPPSPSADAPLSEERRQAVHASFARQGLMRQLGAELLSVEAGCVELRLPWSERVTQQQGGFHGGAMGALADIAGGYAAMTLVPEGSEVTTAEYKINFLAAHAGGELRARGTVVRAGRRLIVTQAEVVHLDEGGRESPCALMQQTIVPVARQY